MASTGATAPTADRAIYLASLVHRRVVLDVAELGGDLAIRLESSVAADIEGKCIVEGFVRPQSVKIVSYSSGLLSSSFAEFAVVVQCDVCCPTEGQSLRCVVTNVTKAGVRAEIEQSPSPLMIFVARDHHHKDKDFNAVEPGQKVKVRVIGQRYELNDPYVSVIATLISNGRERSKKLNPSDSQVHGVETGTQGVS